MDALIFFDSDLNNVSIIKEDFPPPETPVTDIKFPSGNLTVTFFRLLPSACSIII